MSQRPMTIDEARLAAHRVALKNDALYRAMWERFNQQHRDVMRRHSNRLDAGAEGMVSHGDSIDGQPIYTHRDVRRIWNVDDLPIVRCLMVGPKWRRQFGVEQRAIADVRPPWYAHIRHGRRWVLCFTLEDDVRELVTSGGYSHERYEELRPGVFAMWSEPLEMSRGA